MGRLMTQEGVLVGMPVCGTLPFMSIRVRGFVQGGRLKVDMPVDLPDNTEVELTVDESDAEDDGALDEALLCSKAEIERGEVFAADDVLDELCPLGTEECRATG